MLQSPPPSHRVQKGVNIDDAIPGSSDYLLIEAQNDLNHSPTPAQRIVKWQTDEKLIRDCDLVYDPLSIFSGPVVKKPDSSVLASVETSGFVGSRFSTPTPSAAGSSVRVQYEQKKLQLASAEARRAALAAKIEERKKAIREKAVVKEARAAEKLKNADEQIARVAAEADEMEEELRRLEAQESLDDDSDYNS